MTVQVETREFSQDDRMRQKMRALVLRLTPGPAWGIVRRWLFDFIDKAAPAHLAELRNDIREILE